ncbi:MAG TPA: FAD-dependent oxidoreductase [Gammaproteobacteria bacterium]|nr:FAD-dependent oxidoreductase [Gammaproteobacteria bacterium]
MSPSEQQHLIIVGAGQAAAQAVQTARQGGFDGSITLIGRERYPPYQRPPLSKKYLAGELARERLWLRPESFYRDKDVRLELGVAVERVDRDRARVHLSDGRALDYGYLLLATGSRPRRLEVPGAELRGIHYLRAIDDVDGIAADFAPGRKLVLIGAGYIGLEVAAVAAQRGLDVTVLEAADRIMGRVVGAEISAFYARYHAERGVHIRCNTPVTGFAGGGRVEGVETPAGRVPCDVAVVGIGVVPNVELAEQAGLACDDGILVDAFARTEDPRVLAAGDCTRHPHPLFDYRVRLESVQNAIEQAKAAASNLTSAPRRYDEVPWFWSDQYDLKLQIAGLARGYDESVVRGSVEQRAFSVLYLREGRLIAVEAVNSPRDFMAGRKLIAAGLAASRDDFADAADLAALAARAESARDKDNNKDDKD